MLASVRRLVSILVVGLLLGACGSPADTAADVTTATTPARAADEGGAAGPASSESAGIVPFGVVETVDGATIDGADYAGQDLALWFWAPW